MTRKMKILTGIERLLSVQLFSQRLCHPLYLHQHPNLLSSSIKTQTLQSLLVYTSIVLLDLQDMRNFVRYLGFSTVYQVLAIRKPKQQLWLRKLCFMLITRLHNNPHRQYRFRLSSSSSQRLRVHRTRL